MNCISCNKPNDADAVLCTECGSHLSETGPGYSQASKQFLYIVILISALVAAAGIGYYRFVLPAGVVAVVNKEEIRRSELEAELARLVHARAAQGGGMKQEALRRIRYEALTSLVRETLLLQEARKAGISVSDIDIDTALAKSRQTLGMTGRQFDDYILKAYGGKSGFRDLLKRRMIIDRFISEKIIHGISTREGRDAALSSWFRAVSAGSQIRISLSEQWSGSGCGCCLVNTGAAHAASDGSGKL